MKIWKSFSSDHSAKLRIVGKFKTAKGAQDAANLFNELLAVREKDKGKNLYFSDELMKVFEKFNFHSFSENDPETLDLFYPLTSTGNTIVIETDDMEIQAILKVFVNYGAKVEVYSRHDYPD